MNTTSGLKSPHWRARGFTFVELTIAMGILLLFSAITLAAFTQFNRFAAASRLRVHALALAQQRIDEVLTTQWRVGAARPAVLALGNRTETELVINADELNLQNGLGSIFTPLSAPVKGERTIQVEDVSARTLRATVNVKFIFANRTYQVSMTTLRATDTI
jgi:prepilin-type N-terminal cleavage/methylation domain-containing protein